MAHESIEDRRAAIAHAVASASDHDVVLIAGKGHETYQEIAGRRLPFSDALEAEEGPRAMEPMMSLREAATAIGARVIGEDVRFDSVSTDSRTLQRGALFVALSGERFDGRRFIGSAKERGAAATMVAEEQSSGRRIENCRASW